MDKKYRLSQFNHITGLPDSPDSVIFNFKTRRLMRLNPVQKRILDLAPFDNIDSPLGQTLYKKGFLTDADDEYENLFSEMEQKKGCSRTMHLTVCTTMSCNFACKYCLETGYLRNTSMKKEVQEASLNFFDHWIETHEIERLQVVWFGGEPLLAPEVILSLSEHMIRVADSRGIRYEACVYTNGYLLDEKMLRLLEHCRVNMVRISIDGSKRFHDEMRVLKNGKGTYETIMNNLRIPAKITYRIRCNMTRQNKDCFDELKNELQTISEESGNRILVKPERMRVERDVDRDLKAIELSYPEYYDLSNRLIRKQRKEDPGYLEDLMIPKEFTCSACNPNGFVIDNEGDILKCIFHVGDKSHAIGNVLSFPTEGFHSDAPDLRLYSDYVMTKREKCRTCKLLPLCLGRCPLTQTIEGRYDCLRYIHDLDGIVLDLYQALRQDAGAFIADRASL